MTNDIHDVKIIIYHPIQNADVLVKVHAENPEHYKTLRVKVTKETPTSFVLHTTKLDASNVKSIDASNNNGLLLYLPSVPLDGKMYSVQLESSLTPQLNKDKGSIIYFTSNNSFQFVDLKFSYKSNSVNDEQIKQTSVWTLLFIFVILFAMYNIDYVSSLVTSKLTNINLDFITNLKSKTSNSNEINNDNADIDQIVQNINATKRNKTKSRKI